MIGHAHSTECRPCRNGSRSTGLFRRHMLGMSKTKLLKSTGSSKMQITNSTRGSKKHSTTSILKEIRNMHNDSRNPAQYANLTPVETYANSLNLTARTSHCYHQPEFRAVKSYRSLTKRHISRIARKSESKK